MEPLATIEETRMRAQLTRTACLDSAIDGVLAIKDVYENCQAQPIGCGKCVAYQYLRQECAADTIMALMAPDLYARMLRLGRERHTPHSPQNRAVRLLCIQMCGAFRSEKMRQLRLKK